MHDPKSLQIFFDQYMPAMKRVIEDHWQTNRQETIAFLDDCLASGFADSWMQPYFSDMRYWAKTAPHTYSNPWDVL
jgi:hypothetical protein